MQKLKKIVKRFVKKDGIIYKIIRKIYHKLSTLKYKIVYNKKIKEEKMHYSEQAKKSIEYLQKYKNKEYIVFYNPTWLGVAASTIGLFKNNVPLEHVYKDKDIQEIAKSICGNNIKSVIFSQICDGWTTIIKEIKKINSKIKIKVIWHGNCYEYFSDFTWKLNKEVMQLYKENKIDCFAFVRTTMYEFYKKTGFKSFYLQNNVHIDKQKFLSKVNKDEKNTNNKIKIGIYNADTRELKNIYTALSAIKLIDNGVADVVPINEGAKKFAEVLELETTTLDDYIPKEEFLKRVCQNDINLYPTFTENSPMFPLESFDLGVPCLLGNNNDYFVETKLGEYVILEKEDDAEYIKNKILNSLEHKDEIMRLYEEWKIEFDLKCERLVEEFEIN